LILLLFQANLIGESIIHDKIYNAPNNLPCLIEAFLDVPQHRINHFSLLYRPIHSVEYLETPMMPIGHLKYIAEIPGNFLIREKIEYYLLLKLINGEVVTFPEKDAIEHPIIIQIDEPIEIKIPITPSENNNFDIRGLMPKIIILSPQPGERINSQDLSIALSYFSEEDIDSSRIQVYIDGEDVTAKADIHSTYLSIKPETIKPGIHTVTIMITNNLDQKYNDFNWSFTVVPKNMLSNGIIQKQSGSFWTNFNWGNIGSTMVSYNNLNLNYELNLDWLKFSTKCKKSNLENEYSQPYDRYSFHFNNKLMSVILGDSYPMIDENIIYGHHVRGINANLYMGPLSIHIIKGNTARAVQGNPNNSAVVSYIDSSRANWIISLSRSNYTFQQELFATKINIDLSQKIKWSLNYVQVEDNINSVLRSVSNPQIVISTTDSTYLIQYDTLLDDYKDIFGENTSLSMIPTENWLGKKPQSNFIYGSNIKFIFDDSRIQLNSGFSVSFLNRNMWNNVESITDYDTLSVDGLVDGNFFNLINLDNTIQTSQYEQYFTFGTIQQPLLPLMFQNDTNSILDILNMSNLNRYNKLELRYLGHRLEIGNKRNGPDYYTILNPSLKTNFSENYFSDRINLFQNKLLLYYKRSSIKEGLYSEQNNTIQTNKNSVNISLFPGIGLPTFNIGFVSSYRNNNEKKIIDQVTYNTSTETNDLDTIIFIRRQETVNKLFNISMTNQFQLWGKQIVNLSALIFEEEDKADDTVNKDTLLLIEYIPKDASSRSYGLSLKSVYNNRWESSILLNSNYYNYIQSNYNSLDKQYLQHIQLNITYHSIKYLSTINCGLHYSNYWGNSNLIKYNLNIQAESELTKNFFFSLNINYNIKFNNKNNFDGSDSLIKAYFRYNIL